MYAKRMLQRLQDYPTFGNKYIGMRAALAKKLFGTFVCQKRLFDAHCPSFTGSVVLVSLQNLARSGYFPLSHVYLGIYEGRVSNLSPFERALFCLC